ncbi:MAG TPA: VOC family protein [Candidatus Acidoferrales bacterium]|nr:VOC family protein [Candidatus Acidoferrales bacterium]
MAKLRHFALYTPDPETTAAFYKKAFDMIEVGRTNSTFAEGIFLSDGTLNLACLRYKSPQAAARYGSSSRFGMSHFGFWVEDLESTRRRLRDLGAEYIDTRDPDAAPMGFFEEKWKGPDGTVIDITDQGWVGAAPPSEK